jgi:aryl-alcohol dehydrogenase-like predicted oxidoreductase
MIDAMPFGSTGHVSSRVIFGAAAMGGGSERLFDSIMETLLEFGINHIDTAASYGESEVHLARWMPEHRDKFFLASKTGDRTGDAARASLERSLVRLGVDHLDLIQLHNLVEEDDWQQAFSPNGAVHALFKACDEGLVHNVGVTGHGLRIAAIHQRSIDNADFASVLLPYSHMLLQNPAYAADVEALLASCADRDIAVQTIKSVARRRWIDPELRKFSWYEPLDAGPALANAVHFVQANSQVFLNTSSDARLLRPTLEAAAAFDRAPNADMLEADRMANAMTPLFDGSTLEVI